MSEQELAAKMNEALAKVNPDRRKFLGILLAGVAVAPLLNTASLAAEDKTGVQQGKVFPKTQTQGKVFPKTQTAVKGNTAIKNSNESIKLTNASEHKNNSDIWIKSSTGIKNTNSAIKNTNAGAIKNTNESIKLTNANTHKNSSGANPQPK